MNELLMIREKIRDHGVLAFDLETTSKDYNKAEVTLVAMAAGYGKDIFAVALPPSPEVFDFLKEQTSRPGIRVIGFNSLGYDFEVLHLRGHLDYRSIQARLVDVLPLTWLQDENPPHDLKFSAKKFLGVTMTTYDEAFVSSPAILQIAANEAAKRQTEAELKVTLKKFKEAASAERKRLDEAIKEKFREKRTKEDREARKALAARIDQYMVEKFEKPVEDLKQACVERITGFQEENRRLNLQAAQEQKAYAENDARQTLRLYYNLRRRCIQNGLLRWADIEIKNRRVTTYMALRGVHVDPERLMSLEKEFVPYIEEFEAEVYDIAKEEFNPRSPSQVSEVIYDHLGVPDISGEKKTGEPFLSRIEHPIGMALLNFRVIDKLYRTYVKKMAKRAAEDPEHRIHGKFNPNGTVTGRYSSKDPNLQNIPSRSKQAELGYDTRIKDLGPRIRWAFCAPKGRKLICADLSQIELRLIAQVTQDVKLLEVYNKYDVWNGLRFYTGDIHDLTARALNVPRGLAKNLNFGVCYGMGGAKFSRYARLYRPGTKEYDVVAGRGYRDRFMDLYAGIPETIQWYQDAWDGVGHKFPIRTFPLLTGRVRHIKYTPKIHGGTVFNSIIQGSAADILKVVVWKIYENIVCNPMFKGTDLVLQIHDEVLIETTEDLAEKVGIAVKYIMERPWLRLDVPVLASVKICDDWSGKDNKTLPEIGIVPPKDLGIKPATAMLTEEQTAWAATILPRVECYSADVPTEES